MARRGTAPTAITDKQIKELCTALKAGYTDTAACRLVGVHVEVFRYWCRHGGHSRYSKSKEWVPPDKARVEFRRFVRRIEAAQAQGEQEAFAAIRNAFERDWRAAAWFLARRYPERWGSQRERPGKVLEQHEGGVIVWIPDNNRGDGPDVQQAQPPEGTTT